MKPLKAHQITGTWATLLLPVNCDESIDYGKLADEIDFLIESGIDGIYSNGTAGEFYAQTDAEFEKISILLAEKCERAKMPFQIGATHTEAQKALKRAKIAAELKPGAIQLIYPIVAGRFDRFQGSLPRLPKSGSHGRAKLKNPSFRQREESSQRKTPTR